MSQGPYNTDLFAHLMKKVWISSLGETQNYCNGFEINRELL